MNNKHVLTMTGKVLSGVLLGGLAVPLLASTQAFADSSITDGGFKIKAVNTKYGISSVVNSFGNDDKGGNSPEVDDNTPTPEAPAPLMVFTMGELNSASGSYEMPSTCNATVNTMALSGVSSDLVFTKPDGTLQKARNGSNQLDQFGLWSLSGGTFDRLGSASGGHNISCLTSVDTWRNTGTTSIERGFERANSLKEVKESPSTVTNMNYAFSNMSSNPILANLNTSNVTNMSHVFYLSQNFNRPIDSWKVDKVVDMNNMFWNASSFDQSLASWKVNNVDNMSNMFYAASNFNKTIADWDTSNVTRMNNMFSSASRFDQNINNWDVSKVIHMNGMFNDATAFNEPLDKWGLKLGSKIPTNEYINMSNMFYGASSFDQNINSWDVSKVNNMTGMFRAATAFDGPLNLWLTNEVTSMSTMFYEATTFNQNISMWNVDKVTASTNFVKSTDTKLSTANTPVEFR